MNMAGALCVWAVGVLFYGAVSVRISEAFSGIFVGLEKESILGVIASRPIPSNLYSAVIVFIGAAFLIAQMRSLGVMACKIFLLAVAFSPCLIFFDFVMSGLPYQSISNRSAYSLSLACLIIGTIGASILFALSTRKVLGVNNGLVGDALNAAYVFADIGIFFGLIQVAVILNAA